MISYNTKRVPTFIIIIKQKIKFELLAKFKYDVPSEGIMCKMLSCFWRRDKLLTNVIQYTEGDNFFCTNFGNFRIDFK